MFDLKQSIADWRQQMLAAGINTPVPLEELESHLHEDIEQQMTSGLTAQRAFEDAIRQIGRADMIKNEFEKIDATKMALTLKQYRTIMVACLGVESLFWITCLLLKTGNLSEITAGQQMSGLAAVAVMVLLAGVGFLGHGPFRSNDPVGNGSDLHFKRQAVGAFVGVVFLLHHRAGWIFIHSSQIRWGTALDHAAPGRNSVWLHWGTGKSCYEKKRRRLLREQPTEVLSNQICSTLNKPSQNGGSKCSPPASKRRCRWRNWKVICARTSSGRCNRD